MIPLTETNLEKGTYDLFSIWLPGFFDGAQHAVGGNTNVQFPKAVFGFAQSALPQPLNPTAVAGAAPTPLVGITMIMGKTIGRVDRRWGTVDGDRQQVNYKKVRVNFWVRSSTADDSDRLLVMSAGQLLESILANQAVTRPLAQNGVHRIRPGTAEPVADSTYILRLLACEMTLKYAVLSQ